MPSEGVSMCVWERVCVGVHGGGCEHVYGGGYEHVCFGEGVRLAVTRIIKQV